MEGINLFVNHLIEDGKLKPEQEDLLCREVKVMNNVIESNETVMDLRPFALA
jgi:hypothetical protein